MSETVDVTQHERVLVVQINREAKRNAIAADVTAGIGAALGGGFEVVLSCDLVVAARTATFGLPEVHRSLVPICGGLFRAPDTRSRPRSVSRRGSPRTGRSPCARRCGSSPSSTPSASGAPGS